MAVPTFGVEEEFFLADMDSGELREDADDILDSARGSIADGLDHELRAAMAETGTAVCRDVASLRQELGRRRSALRSVAESRGAIVLASATHPTARAHRVGYGDDERYERMAQTFGRLADEALVCGCHVHVQVPDPESGVRVIDGIGGWLPVLLAASANSPFWEGQDTQFDSWRARVWARWPTAGPTSPFGSHAAYEKRSADLIAGGAALDPGMLYYDARLSQRYPTVEIRVADVCIEAEDVVVIAALARALVMAALRSPADFSAPAVELRRAGNFAAARWGLGGRLFDPRTGQTAEAAVLLCRLAEVVADALDESGDTEAVRDGIERILSVGNGAARQRAARRRGGTPAVLDLIRVR